MVVSKGVVGRLLVGFGVMERLIGFGVIERVGIGFGVFDLGGGGA